MTHSSRKLQSRVWYYFSIVDDEFARCNFCNLKSKYKKSTSAMLRHLRRKHLAQFMDTKSLSGNQNVYSKNLDILNKLENNAIVLKKGRGPTWRFRSRAWEYFSKLKDGKAQCSICNKYKTNYTGTTSGMLKHLRRKHKTEYKIASKNKLEEMKNTFEKNAMLLKNSGFRSRVWDYFSKLKDGKAQCSICKIYKTTTKGTSSMLEHLRKKHNTEYDIASKNKLEELRNYALKCKLLGKSHEIDLNDIDKHIDILKDKLGDNDNVSASEKLYSYSENPSESILDNKLSRKISEKAIAPSLSKSKRTLQKTSHLSYEAFIEMLSLDMLPKQILTGHGFQKLMLTVCPDSKIPTKQEVTNMFTTTAENLRKDFKQKIIKSSYIALSMDIWKHRNTEDMITLRSHFIDSSWNRDSYVLDTVNFTSNSSADAIASKLKKIADDFEIIEKVTSISSNSLNEHVITAVAANIWNHLDCFGTIINNVLIDALNNVPEIITIQEKVVNATNYLRMNREAAEHLLSIQQEHNVPTSSFKTYRTNDWLSTYKLFKLTLEQYEAINTVLCYMKLDTMSLCDEVVEVIRKIIEILEIFKVATSELSVEPFISASKVIPLSNLLQQVVSENLDTAEVPLIDFLSSICRQMELQFKNFEVNYNLAAATFLDPRFKAHGFKDSDSFEVVKERLMAETLNILQTENPCTVKTNNEEKSLYSLSLWKNFDKRISESGSLNTSETEVENEITRYLKEPNIERSECPLQWWSLNEVQFPNLKVLAKKYLVIPATCVQSDRLFTSERHVFKEKLDMINSEDVMSMIFLNANYK